MNGNDLRLFHWVPYVMTRHAEHVPYFRWLTITSYTAHTVYCGLQHVGVAQVVEQLGLTPASRTVPTEFLLRFFGR